ncbi:helix-turn-helix domain-containing protein [Nocardiopsis sp. EMB25]|uniref:helix-turn-helix transcriptional regulator n=1 Tax=Nocardiopsis sp. EMB25 TaxID=2835867 RepID=UPI002284CD1F|nr:helix-turn-helix domain-containing protein [Nocardiopsis sp. EMB25]MCY9786672.1 helix-turn-helix domain-containing protein [Nocardiopsis sp. EMB25]
MTPTATTSTAPNPRTALWSVKDTAAYLQVPSKTLYEWRYKGDGPPSHRVGRYVRYLPDEVHAWVRSR